VLVAVAFIDAQDQLLPHFTAEVQVYVWDGRHFLIEEATDNEDVLDGIYVAEANQVADERPNAAAPSPSRRLAAMVGAVYLSRNLGAELQQVVIDEEEAGQAVLGDQPQLIIQAWEGDGILVRGVFAAQPFQAEAAQRLVRSFTGRAGIVREAIAQVAGQIKLAAFGNTYRVGQRIAIAGKQACHLLGRLEIELAVGAAQRVRSVQRGAVLDGNQRILQPVALADVVVHVVGGHNAQVQLPRQGGERAVAGGIAMDEVLLELQEEAVRAEERVVAFRGCARVR